MMKQIVDNFIKETSSKPVVFPIPKKDYLQWTDEFIFNSLRGERYGQSFCNQFEIHDNILFYIDNAVDAHRYILENYINE